MNKDTILDFWFNTEHKPLWFVKDTQFDQKIADQFQKIHHQASQAELWSWRTTAEGRLAEIIILDQFSRNIFRDRPQAFAQDALALALAQEAISLRVDEALSSEARSFLYMPFMHSESEVIHMHAVRLFEALGNPLNLAFEHKHKVIIDRFGRYPHRNQILGRSSTAEEIQFLSEPDSHF